MAMTQIQRRLIVFMPLVAPLVALAPHPAEAHAVLVASDPPPGSSVPMGYVTFTLKFNSKIDRNRSRCDLIGPNGERPNLTIAPGGPDDTIQVSFIASAGPNIIRWQVLAFDGHITRGEVQFTALRG